MFFAVSLMVASLVTAQEHECKPVDCGHFCGTDGETYRSDCEFNLAKKTNTGLEKIYYGECGYPMNKPKCPINMTYDPHCANDGFTYYNGYDFQCHAKVFPKLKLLYRGECEPERSNVNKSRKLLKKC